MIQLSVVIPVYGCASCLSELHRRLATTLDDLGETYEIVLVDDRSPDGAWATMQELAAAHHEVTILRLSRNFGQHAAITAGLAESTGRWVVVMDCDLQDPPEAITELWATAQRGYDVVLSRRARRRQSLARRLAGNAYYRIRNFLVRTDMYTNYTNLSIISRKVADAFLTLRDRDRQYLLIVHWLGFHHASIEVESDERHSGRSAYSFSALLRVAVDGMFFQSTALLRWIVYAGFAVASLGLLLVGYTMWVLVDGRPLPDWTALPMLVLLLTGFMLVSTGVTALYVGKIFTQVKGRPLYVIDTRVVGGVERAVPRELTEYAEAPAAATQDPVAPRSMR